MLTAPVGVESSLVTLTTPTEKSTSFVDRGHSTIQKVVLIHSHAKFSSLEMYFVHLSFERRAQGLFVLGEKCLQHLLPILADWMLPMHLYMANPELAVMLCSRHVWNAGIPT